MRIAIGHFHLRAGGVTRVIEMAFRQLVADGHAVAVVVGEKPGERCRVPPEFVCVVPGLRYGAGASEGVSLGAELVGAAREVFGGDPDVLHLHNHALGKNASLPVAVADLAMSGMPMILQLHDFSENGRPANRALLLRELGGEDGLSCRLYPQGPRVHVAVLTDGDRRRFARAGGDAGVIANPVSVPDSEPFDFAGRGVRSPLVYPTRAIRRKNLGEAILWSLLERDRSVVVSSSPENAVDVGRFREWKSFAESLGLTVIFDAQSRWSVPCESLVRGAEACLSTSVAEGFGMAFLEPWSVGVPVVGRDLRDVTSDFARSGVRLDGMYDRLDFPVAWMGRATVHELINRWIAAISGGSVCRDSVADYREIALSRAVRNDRVDFGCLDEALQRAIILRVARDPACADELVPGRLVEPDRDQIAENQTAVTREFDVSAYARALASHYARVASAPAGEVRFLGSRDVFAAMHPFDRFSALLG
jgi:glycosyltransferase involved in cell wall biosynthesis